MQATDGPQKAQAGSRGIETAVREQGSGPTEEHTCEAARKRGSGGAPEILSIGVRRDAAGTGAHCSGDTQRRTSGRQKRAAYHGTGRENCAVAKVGDRLIRGSRRGVGKDRLVAVGLLGGAQQIPLHRAEGGRIDGAVRPDYAAVFGIVRQRHGRGRTIEAGPQAGCLLDCAVILSPQPCLNGGRCIVPGLLLDSLSGNPCLIRCEVLFIARVRRGDGLLADGVLSLFDRGQLAQVHLSGLVKAIEHRLQARREGRVLHHLRIHNVVAVDEGCGIGNRRRTASGRRSSGRPRRRSHVWSQAPDAAAQSADRRVPPQIRFDFAVVATDIRIRPQVEDPRFESGRDQRHRDSRCEGAAEKAGHHFRHGVRSLGGGAAARIDLRPRALQRIHLLERRGDGAGPIGGVRGSGLRSGPRKLIAIHGKHRGVVLPGSIEVGDPAPAFGFAVRAGLQRPGGIGRRAGHGQLGDVAGPLPHVDSPAVERDCAVGSGCRPAVEERLEGLPHGQPGDARGDPREHSHGHRGRVGDEIARHGAPIVHRQAALRRMRVLKDVVPNELLRKIGDAECRTAEQAEEWIETGDGRQHGIEGPISRDVPIQRRHQTAPCHVADRKGNGDRVPLGQGFHFQQPLRFAQPGHRAQRPVSDRCHGHADLLAESNYIRPKGEAGHPSRRPGAPACDHQHHLQVQGLLRRRDHGVDPLDRRNRSSMTAVQRTAAANGWGASPGRTSRMDWPSARIRAPEPAGSARKTGVWPLRQRTFSRLVKGKDRARAVPPRRRSTNVKSSTPLNMTCARSPGPVPSDRTPAGFKVRHRKGALNSGVASRKMVCTPATRTARAAKPMAKLAKVGLKRLFRSERRFGHWPHGVSRRESMSAIDCAGFMRQPGWEQCRRPSRWPCSCAMAFRSLPARVAEPSSSR